MGLAHPGLLTGLICCRAVHCCSLFFIGRRSQWECLLCFHVNEEGKNTISTALYWMILVTAEKAKPPSSFLLFKVRLTKLQCSEKFLSFLLVVAASSSWISVFKLNACLTKAILGAKTEEDSFPHISIQLLPCLSEIKPQVSRWQGDVCQLSGCWTRGYGFCMTRVTVVGLGKGARRTPRWRGQSLAA